MSQFSLDVTQSAVLGQIREEPKKVLDIGSGEGCLLQAVKGKFPKCELHACDYTNEFLKTDIPLTLVDLNDGVLPWKDNSFDLVTITEVVEHLENFHIILREINRILMPNGKVIITTPNILNYKSRVSFLLNGFWNLYGALPFSSKDIESTSGHITPIHYHILSYSLQHAGFSNIRLFHDKHQRSSLGWFPLLFFFTFIFSYFTLAKSRERGQIEQENETNFIETNSFVALTSRSLVVCAEKK